MNFKSLGRKAVALAASLFLLTGAALATDVKLAMNGKNDLATNSEAAYVDAFAESLASTGIAVSVFPSNSIGNEKERLGQVSQGLVQINLATSSTPISLSPFMKGILLPFLFESSAEFDKVMMRSDLIDRINEDLVPNGVRLLGFNLRGMDAGIHNVSHPITKISDLADLRMRAMNESQVEFYSALGASSTIVSWAEVANALQTGIADGYINAPNSSIRTGHTQFLRHFTPMGIFPTARAILVSEDWYSGLTEDERAAVDKANAAGIAANRAWIDSWARQVATKFSEAGVTVSELEPGERERFAAAAASTYKDLVSADTLEAFQVAIEGVRN